MMSALATLLIVAAPVKVVFTRNSKRMPAVAAGSVTAIPAARSNTMVLPSCSASVTVSVEAVQLTMRVDISQLRFTSEAVAAIAPMSM